MVADTLVAVYKADIANFLKGTRQVDASFKGMRVSSVWSMNQIGNAVLRAGRNFFRFAGDVITSGKEFEQAMADLRSVLPRPEQFGDGFDALKERIKEIGATTLFTATQTAQGAEMLAKSGFSLGEVWQSIPATLELATAGALGLKEAADIATNIVKGFGKAAGELGQVVDTVAFAANNSNTTVSELGRAFSFVSSVVRPFNIEVNSTVASLAQLADVGIKGGRAGRNLSTAFSDIIKKASELNIKLDDGNGKMKDFAGILQAVEDAGLDAVGVIANFSKQTSRTILALRAGGGDLTAFAKEAEKLGLDVFNAEGNLKKFNEVVDVLAKEGMLDLLDLIPSASDEIADFTRRADASGLTLSKVSEVAKEFSVDADKLSTAVKGSQEAIKQTGIVSASSGAALIRFAKNGLEGAEASRVLSAGLNQFSEGAANAGVNLEDISGNLLELDEVMEVLGERGITTAEQVKEEFGEEAAQVFEMIKTEGVSSFAELTEEVRKFSGEAEGAGARMANIRASTLTGQLKKLGSAFDGLKTAIFDLGLGQLLTDIAHGITVLLNDANDFVQANKEAIAGFFAEIRAKVIPVLDGLRAEVAPIMEAMGAAFARSFETFTKAAQGIAENKDVIISVFSGISKAVEILVDVFLTGLAIFNKIPEPMRTMIVTGTALAAVLGPLTTLVRGFALGLATLISPALAATKTLLFMATGFVGPVAAAIALGIAVVAALAIAYKTNFGGIRDAVNEAVGRMMPALRGIKEFFAKVIPPILEFLARVFMGAFRTIAEAVSIAIRLIDNIIGNSVEFFTGVVQIYKGIAEGDWQEVWNGFKRVVASSINTIIGFIEGLVNSTLSLVGNFLGVFNKGLKENLKGLSEGITAKSKELQALISDSLAVPDQEKTKEEYAKIGEDVLGGIGEGVAKKGADVKALFDDIMSTTFKFEDAGEGMMDSLGEGIDKGKGEATDAAAEAAKELKEAFDNELKNLGAQLELGAIRPEQAKKALEEIRGELLLQVKALKDAGKTGTEAFSTVAEMVGQVDTELDKVNEAISEAINKTHGVTEATTAWLNKLQAQSDLGLRSKVEIFKELKVEVDKTFQKILDLQEGGLSKEEMPFFNALVERHGALLNVMDSVESEMLEELKLEEEIAQKSIDLGKLTLEDHIKNLQERLLFADLTTGELKLLEEQLAENQETLAKKKEAAEKALFQFRRDKAELNKEQIIAHLEEEVAKHKEGTAEKIAAEKQLWEAKKKFAELALDLEEAILSATSAAGFDTLAAEIQINKDRLALFDQRKQLTEEEKIARANLNAEIIAQERELFQQEQALEDKRLELAVLKNEKGTADEIAHYEIRLAAFQGTEEDKLGIQNKLANLRIQQAQEESEARKEQFEAAKKLNVEAVEAFVAGLEQEKNAAQGNFAQRQALEEDFKDFSIQSAELRQKANEDAAKAIAKSNQDAVDEMLKATQIAIDAGDDVVESITKVNEGNAKLVEQSGKLIVKSVEETDESISKLNKSNAKEVEATGKLIVKSVDQTSDSIIDISKDNAKAVEVFTAGAIKSGEESLKTGQKLHDEQLKLNQKALQNHIQTLKSRLSELEANGDKEAGEYETIQEQVTEAERIFHERRVTLSVQEAKQKLFQAEITKVGYVEELERIMHSEGVSVEDRIDLAKKLADFKRDEFGSLSNDEITFLENVLAQGQFNAKEEEALTNALTILKKDNAKEVEQAVINADDNAKNHAIDTSNERKEAWVRDTKDIIASLFEVSRTLEDLSPVAANVTTFVGRALQNVVTVIKKVGEENFKVADAFIAIGHAAQSSSDLAISSLGGVVTAITQIASGNLIGGIASGITTAVSFIGGLFGKTSKKAKQLREQMAEIAKFTKSIASSFNSIEIFSGVSAGGIEFDIKELLPADDDTNKLTEIEKKFVDGIFKFRERVGNALGEVGLVLKDKFGIFGRIFDLSGTNLSAKAEGLLSSISNFAGKYAAEVLRLEEAIVQANAEGRLNDKIDLSNQLESVIEQIEFWGGQFNEAVGFVKSSFSKGLGSIFIENDSFEAASESLRDNFRKHIIQSMFQMAIESSGATAVLASKMADLQVIMQKAFSEENFDGVREAVANVARDLDNQFKKISDAVGGAIGDVFGDLDNNTNATVNVDTNASDIETRANVTVNLDTEDVDNFTAGTEELAAFGDMWTDGIIKLGQFTNQFSMTSQELQDRFIPNIDGITNSFGRHTDNFGLHVAKFGGHVETFDNSVLSDRVTREQFANRMSKISETIERNVDKLTFSERREVI